MALPAPVDALAMLRDELVGKQVVDARMNEESGDPNFRFDDDAALQVFNFTAFEIWAVTFPDGAVELSNSALER